MKDLWQEVDRYLDQQLIGPDPLLEQVLRTNAEAGLPAFDVAPNQGKLLHLLVRMCGARRVLEIGTLGGYSTIWLARAVPEGGFVLTLESDPHHAETARYNFAQAGLGEKIELRVGHAVQSLADLVQEGTAPFDFIFIDADKPNNPAYLEWSLKLSRPGTVIVGDNVIRDGAITDAAHPDPRVQGVRHFFDDLAKDPRLSATALQTVGSKGYDGFVLALVEKI